MEILCLGDKIYYFALILDDDLSKCIYADSSSVAILICNSIIPWLPLSVKKNQLSATVLATELLFSAFSSLLHGGFIVIYLSIHLL